MEFLETYKDQIQNLCKSHNVKNLYSFGSVVTNNLKHESDIDLIVEIETSDPFEYSDNYFDLKFNLERIFNRTVDLLENKSIKNSYLRENIDNSKVLIYGQGS